MTFDGHTQEPAKSERGGAAGPPSLPPTGISPTVSRILDRALQEAPTAEALIGRYARYTYEQLDCQVSAATAALQSLGAKEGERVAASALNCPDLVIAYLAVMRIGAIWIGVPAQLAGPEKAYLLRDSGALIALLDRSAAEQIESQRRTLPALRTVMVMDADEPDGEWARLVAAHKGAPAYFAEIDRLAPAAIAYTSGTSGTPKGVVHSQHNIMVAAASTLCGARGDQGPANTRRGASIPLTILNVMVLTAVTSFSGVGSLVCIDRRDTVGIVDWVKSENIQHLNLSGAHLHDMLHNGTTREDVASLLFVNNAGAGIPVALREDVEREFGFRMLTSYGLTEALTGVSGFPVGAPLVEGSSGTVNRHMQVIIKDPDGQPCPVGAKGEICIRAVQDGPWAGMYRPMLGYWRLPEETAKSLRNGWLYTGDLGSIDEHGHLFVSGRTSEVILRGGANVYPAEIERVLQAIPIVRDAAVLGRTDERLGQRIVAVIELEAGVPQDSALATIRGRCADELARYKQPSEWHFMEVLPRTAMNKLSRKELQARYGSA